MKNGEKKESAIGGEGLLFGERDTTVQIKKREAWVLGKR